MRTRRQRMGQHFLRDSRVARAIVDALPDAPPRVLEIGPGAGALTRPLLERFSTVRAVELDGALAAALPERLGRPPGLEVLHADALRADLDELAGGGAWLVAANLPYSVGTAVLRRLLPRADLFPVLVVMLQDEVVDRLLALPGSADRGLITLEVEAHARAVRLFGVSPRAFAPPPRVDSAVLRLALRPPAEPALALALALASAAFSHRRKTLANGIAGELSDPASVLAAAGVEGGRRPQELTLDEWLAVSRAAGGGA